MTDPVPTQIRPRPRPQRATPLQPDRPLREDGSDLAAATDAKVGVSDKGTSKDAASVKRQEAQSAAALDNVRKGYD